MPRSRRNCCSRERPGWTVPRSPIASSGSGVGGGARRLGRRDGHADRRCASGCPRRSRSCAICCARPSFPSARWRGSRTSGSRSCCSCAPSRAALADEQFARAVYAPTARYATPAGGQRDERAGTDARRRARFLRRALPAVGDDARVRRRRDDGGRARRWPSSCSATGSGDAGRRSRARSTPRQRSGSCASSPRADAPQSELRVGHVGLPRRHPDYFDAMVMNAVLGGLFSSRINLNLREAHGYTYGAFSAFEWRRGAGPFVDPHRGEERRHRRGGARDPEGDRRHAARRRSARTS